MAQKERLVKERLETDVWQTSGGRRLGQTSGVTSQPKTKENSVGKGVNREWGQRLNCKRVAECLLTASGRDGVGFSRDVEAEVLRQLCSLG